MVSSSLNFLCSQQLLFLVTSSFSPLTSYGCLQAFLYSTLVIAFSPLFWLPPPSGWRTTKHTTSFQPHSLSFMIPCLQISGKSPRLEILPTPLSEHAPSQSSLSDQLLGFPPPSGTTRLLGTQSKAMETPCSPVFSLACFVNPLPRVLDMISHYPPAGSLALLPFHKKTQNLSPRACNSLLTVSTLPIQST